MPLSLSHVAVKIGGLCSVYIVYGAKFLSFNKKMIEILTKISAKVTIIAVKN